VLLRNIAAAPFCLLAVFVLVSVLVVVLILVVVPILIVILVIHLNCSFSLHISGIPLP